MGSFGRTFYTASPVIAMSPQAAHQAGFAMPPVSSQVQPLVRTQPTANMANHPLSHSDSLRSAGRKRSRDEAAPNLTDEPTEQHLSEHQVHPDADWEYGEGMVLIKRKNGYVTDASSQSGTWLEDKLALDQVEAAAAASARPTAQERPLLRSNKSQRLDAALTPSLAANADIRPPEPAPVGQQTNGYVGSAPPSGGMCQPTVDDFTMHLGIGWRKISEEQHIQAAARGWARYIENHYPVSSVNVRLESSGLQAYLVETAEGFFLFDENLKQGRLVSTNAETAFQNLKTTPPVFEGQVTIFAADAPTDTCNDSPGSRHGSRSGMDVDMN